MMQDIMWLIEASLLWVVILGVLLNGAMLAASFRRWLVVSPIYPADDPAGLYKAEVARLTLWRAMRLEWCLLLCQLARLAHTLYLDNNQDCVFEQAFWAALAREFMTVIIVYASVADLLTRRRIVRIKSAAHRPVPDAV